MLTGVPGVVMMPAIIGAVQVIKHSGLPSRFAGLLAVLLGIAAAFVNQMPPLTDPSALFSTTLTGIAWGLMAAGLYSGTSALQLAKQSPQSSAPMTIPATPTTSATMLTTPRFSAVPTDLMPRSPAGPSANAGKAVVPGVSPGSTLLP